MSVFVAELATLSLLLFAWPAAGTDSYINTFGEEVAFDCDVGQALSRFESSRESQSSRPTRKRSGSDHFDRLWDLSCSPIESKAKEYCQEFEMINDPGQKLMLFQCPPNAYIGGVRSIYDSPGAGGEGFDRVWGIKCCRTLGICTRDCSLVGPINVVDGSFDKPAKAGFFFTGLFSIYEDTSGDRLFYLQQCRAAQCGSRKLLKYIYPWAKY